MRTSLITSFLLMVTASASAVLAADSRSPDYAKQLPRAAPLEPAEALRSFRIVSGFRIEQIAAEPLVTDPIAMAFDEDGRVFIVEMRDYSEHPNDHLGRIRLLEDTDGDGHLDRATLFAEGLSWPTAIACSQGGIYVGAAPDILYLKDTDGDGKADVKKTIFTGFGRGNVQGLLNTFLHGLDHRIHCAASSAAGVVRRVDDPNFKPVDLRGRDFAFDPITLALETITGGGQHGATFDDFGRRFVCSNSDHIQMIMIEDRDVAKVSSLLPPPMRMSISADGPQAEVYRISPVEPWRVLRTELRVKGKVPGPIEGGGRAAGYFTSATGLTIYRGDAWPAQHRGTAFVADVGSNIIHRKKLASRGIGFIATRTDEKAEFLASTDTWFRPVQMASAPDGTLWIADMYREVIEHPASLPPAIKKHLDLNSGRDRGRIYRIVPEGFKQRAVPKLGKATTNQLVALFEHENAWHRETASRLIHQRQDAASLDPMRKMLRESKSAVAQLHAMYGIAGLGKLTHEDVLLAMQSGHPDVCEHALRLAEPFVAGNEAVMNAVLVLADHSSPRVQFQACLTMAFAEGPRRAAIVAQVIRRHGDDPYIRWAALRSIGGSILSVIQALSKQDGNETLIASLLAELAKDEIVPVLRSLRAAELAPHPSVLLALAQSIIRTGGDVSALFREHSPAHLPLLMQMWDDAEKNIKSENPVANESSIAAIATAPAIRSAPLLAAMLNAQVRSELQNLAAEALARYSDSHVTPHLVGGVTLVSPSARIILLRSLLMRKDRMESLIEAIETSKIPASMIDGESRTRLLLIPDEKLRARASRLFMPAPDRQAVVARYLKETETLKGDPLRGKAIFAAQCAACHRVDNVGHDVGPNLAAFAVRGSEAILTNLFDPNREVNPLYQNILIEMKDGEIVTGIMVSENQASISVKAGNSASRTVARNEIASLRATGKSLMPEGLESAISPQAAADMLGYLASLKEKTP